MKNKKRKKDKFTFSWFFFFFDDDEYGEHFRNLYIFLLFILSTTKLINVWYALLVIIYFDVTSGIDGWENIVHFLVLFIAVIYCHTSNFKIFSSSHKLIVNVDNNQVGGLPLPLICIKILFIMRMITKNLAFVLSALFVYVHLTDERPRNCYKNKFRRQI